MGKKASRRLELTRSGTTANRFDCFVRFDYAQCAARNGPAGRVSAIDERTGFDPFPTDAERFFSFWSVQSRAEDGKVTEVQAGRVAELRGCFALHYCRNVHPGQNGLGGRETQMFLDLCSP